MNNTLRVIPLGGLGEIGMNMMVYQCGDEAIIVDCGMMFPDSATLGVDVIVPDMTWVFERASMIKGVFLTHGHEDHIGALPFLLDRIDAPVYGSALTLGFVRGKLEEFEMTARLEVIRPRETVEAGSFRIEAIQVTHSIVDALGFAIRTPAGTIIHTGDFKIDHTPIDGRTTDLARLTAYGEEGVLLLASDSTNVMVPGHGRSERTVGTALDSLFAAASGRIIITTFSSHIHRIQQIIDVAIRHHRRVTLIGRSLTQNVEIASQLGYLRFPREARNDGELSSSAVIITTGTQGEPHSALSRMAIGEHRQVQIDRGDTVMISARAIPGNEKAIIRLIDNLYRRGAQVLTYENAEIHVSGHACQEELKLMMQVTKPRFFIPLHGTLRHLVHHGKLAAEMGIPHGAVITNGQMAEIGDKIVVTENVIPHGKVFIDGESEEVPEVVVRDRKHLAEDGFVIVVVAIDSDGRPIRDPEIITRGLVHVDASQELLDEVRSLLVGTLAESTADELRDSDGLQEKLRALLKRYFRKTLGRRPLILPVIWEM